MKKTRFKKFFVSICVVMFAFCGVFAQSRQLANTSQIKSQEVSEKDGVPVLIKHLPEWENAQKRAVYILNQNDLQKALGARQIFDAIDFQGGTEAVTAAYPQGRLLIVEYVSGQASIEADNRIKEKLNEVGQNPPTFYRRTGNYNIFVFDATDEAAANSLIDQVKYEKTVQWLGDDPYAFKKAERAFIEGTSTLFMSIVQAIAGGIGLSILAGLGIGVIFFYFRTQRRAKTEAFSDAGGMTRLNLDEWSSNVASDKLLGK